MRIQDLSDLSFGQEILWMAPATTTRFLASLIPRQEDTPYLEAVAIKRVLCTSEDFNALIYTAVNIQAIQEKESAVYLLQDGAAFRRLVELAGSPDQMLASSFSRAFSHLLLGGQSTELFVGHDDRHLYAAKVFPSIDQYYGEPHPLQRTVTSMRNRLKANMESSAMNPDDSNGSLFYFELLELMLDEESDNQRFSQWLCQVIERSPPLKVSTPLVIWLVTETVRILNMKIASTADPLRPQRPQLSLGPEQAEAERQMQEQERSHFFAIQQTRVGVVKELISQAGWEMLLVPTDRGESILAGIKAAFGDRAYSPPTQCSDKPKLWLLEQALLIATQNLDKNGWEFVAENTVDLLCSFDTRPEAPMSDPTSYRDDQKDNHLHGTEILSQCLQAMRANGDADYILFTKVLIETPDLYHVSLLSNWLEIRDTLAETLVDRDKLSRSDEAATVYLRGLRLTFAAIELAASMIPNADGNPADPPRPQTASLEVEQTESNNAVTGRIAADSDGSNRPIHHPTGDKCEVEERGDAQDVQGAGTSDQHQRAGDDG
ncbi:hypothetical protein FRC01_009800 [Tulasnella sp. 417]|nr:hypothetical protein FRC01_009800 [Tulasnella sp. 417]